MKKIYIISAIAVAAIAVSCNKIEQPATEIDFSTEFSANIQNLDSKSYIDPSTKQIKFKKNDPIMTWAVQGTKLYAKTVYINSATGVEPYTFNKAEYTGLSESAATYYIGGTNMESGYPSSSQWNSSKTLNWKIYDKQKMTADGLLSNTDKTAIPLMFMTEEFSAPQDKVNIELKHLASYCLIEITNLTLPEDETVSSVKMTSFKGTSKSAQTIYGSITRSATGVITPEAEASPTKTAITVDVSNIDTTTGNFDVYLVLLPCDLSGTKAIFTLTSSGGKQCKFTTKELGSDKGKFQTGHLKPIKLDFTGKKWEQK